MTDRLANKIALITGAARGQGAAEAALFSTEGATVIAADVLDDEGEHTAGALEGCTYRHLDVTDEEAWASLIEETRDRHGRLDVLVNNAAIIVAKPLTEMPLVDYRRVVEVNQVGVFLGMKAVAPLMQQAGSGSIINVSSVDGLKGTPLSIAYGASKWAVRGMTKVAALELAPGVRVNTIFPGAIDTPMLRGVPIVQEHGLDWLADQVPLKRVAEPDDVAMLALYLASDESAYCTGGGVCHRRWPDSLVLACAGSDAASIGAELAAAMRNGRTMDATSLPETYRSILTIRRFEERLLSLHQEGLIQGSMHLCSGQEAIPVGACRELRADDALTATYRGHGWAVARGLPLPDLFAEVMGRDSPLCGGRGGSAYLCGAEYGFLGENSIVGGGVPIAVGAGLAAQRDGAGAVSLVSIGDGALNQGAVSEALNFAAVFALPVIVVVENNIYSEMTPIKEMVAIDPLAQRAAGFGIPAVTVDGNDAAVVQAAVAEAVSRARSGGGPSLVEAMTERLVGHYTGDAQQYRPAGEVEDAKTREPLTRLRAAAEQQGLSGEFATVEAEVEASIEGAVQEAMTYARPDPAGAAVGVYVD